MVCPVFPQFQFSQTRFDLLEFDENLPFGYKVLISACRARTLAYNIFTVSAKEAEGIFVFRTCSSYEVSIEITSNKLVMLEQIKHIASQDSGKESINFVLNLASSKLVPASFASFLSVLILSM
jgi:hypothetical protein